MRNYQIEVEHTEKIIHKEDDEFDVISKVKRLRFDGFDIDGYRVHANMDNFKHVLKGEIIRIRAANIEGD